MSYDVGIMLTVALKDQFVRGIRDLPEDASIDELMEKLFLLYKIEIGVEQADAGLTVSHEEATQRLGRWLG
jgi:predicted transcriptional regulator